MREPNQVSVITWVAVVLAGSVAAFAQDSLDDVNQPTSNRFGLTVDPNAGFVVKTRPSADGETLDGGWLERRQPSLFAGEGVSAVAVGGEGHSDLALFETPDRNGLAVAALEADPAVDYVAPLFSLNGETVAVIPEIIVRLRQAADREALEDVCRQTGCAIVRNLLYTDLEFLIAPAARNAEDVLATADVLDETDFVEWAYPNLAFQPELYGLAATNEPNRMEPNDTYFDRQWHLNAIRAPEAWAYESGDPNIIVAILDDGVDITHPDLMDNIWCNAKEIPGNDVDDDGNGRIDDVHGWDFYSNDNDPNPTDLNNAHGTACAGLVAAHGNNGIGVTGVTWTCTIMPIRIARTGNYVPQEDVATALRYAAVSGADVLSNSWGGLMDLPAIHSAIRDTTRSGGIGRNGKGCILVFASGNYDRTWGGSVVYPAKYSEVISVGAIDDNDEDWYYNGHGDELDLVAPSGRSGLMEGNLWTTDVSGHQGYNNRDPDISDYTDRMGGTSGACPLVAGVAALILSVDPNLTNLVVARILAESARDLGATGWDEYYGFGCVDACTAVSMALDTSRFVLYVDDDALNDPGPENALISDPEEDGSLDHPFDSVQEAVNKAIIGETVFVLPGKYAGSGNHDIDFGGRAIVVRSKEGPATCIIDCESRGRGFYFHSEEGATSLVEGFTIQSGYHTYGGGISISGSSPTIRNCVLQANRASSGGGLYSDHRGSPFITKCVFTENFASTEGGGLYLSGTSTLADCVVGRNLTTGYNGIGGGLFIGGSAEVTIINCTLSANRSTRSNGGGIYSESFSELYMKNCILVANSAEKSGGGMYIENHAKVHITNCTFVDNTADYGGAICTVGFSSTTNAINSIFWGNTPSQITYGAIVAYSDVQGAWQGTGNIDADPSFVTRGYWDPNGTPDDAGDDFWVNGDYHLTSQGSRWHPVSATWVTDDVTSPCIDAGDPSSPVGEEPEPNGGRINMGAYGGTAQASKSP